MIHERTTRGLAHRHTLALILFTSVVLFAAWWISTHSQESIERTSSSAFVTRFYQQVLGHAPEPGSVDGWVRQIQEFGSVVPTILAFFHSPEFLSHKTTDDQYLTILYRALLRREPDPAEPDPPAHGPALPRVARVSGAAHDQHGVRHSPLPRPPRLHPGSLGAHELRGPPRQRCHDPDAARARIGRLVRVPGD